MMGCCLGRGEGMKGMVTRKKSPDFMSLDVGFSVNKRFQVFL